MVGQGRFILPGGRRLKEDAAEEQALSSKREEFAQRTGWGGWGKPPDGRRIWGSLSVD